MALRCIINQFWRGVITKLQFCQNFAKINQFDNRVNSLELLLIFWLASKNSISLNTTTHQHIKNSALPQPVVSSLNWHFQIRLSVSFLDWIYICKDHSSWLLKKWCDVNVCKHFVKSFLRQIAAAIAKINWRDKKSQMNFFHIHHPSLFPIFQTKNLVTMYPRTTLGKIQTCFQD